MPCTGIKGDCCWSLSLPDDLKELVEKAKENFLGIRCGLTACNLKEKVCPAKMTTEEFAELTLRAAVSGQLPDTTCPLVRSMGRTVSGTGTTPDASMYGG